MRNLLLSLYLFFFIFWFFLLAPLRFFSLSPVLSNLIPVCLDVLHVSCAWILLIFFYSNLEKKLAIFSLLTSFSETPIILTSSVLLCPTLSVLCSLLLFFSAFSPLCVQFEYIAIHSSSLIFSSAISNLLLIPSSTFFSWGNKVFNF